MLLFVWKERTFLYQVSEISIGRLILSVLPYVDNNTRAWISLIVILEKVFERRRQHGHNRISQIRN